MAKITNIKDAISFEEGNRLLREARDRFAEYTQSVGFQITLTKGMIEALHLIREQNSSHIMSRSVTHSEALIRRGLVIHTPPPRNANGKIEYGIWRNLVLTPAGELTVQMLELAKLIPARESGKKRA